MDINRGRVQGFMSEKRFNSKQVSTILIEMCAKSVAEGMAGKTVPESEVRFFCKNKLIDGIRNHMLLRIIRFRKEPATRFSISKPVCGKEF